MVHVALLSEPLDESRLRNLIADPAKGGIVVFSGTVRSVTDGKATSRLFYEAHESMAVVQMQKIAEEAAAKWDANVAVEHRLGEALPGETAVICAAACPHRAAAFECCRYLIDRIKEDVPIWKKEFGPDGEEWK